MTFDVRFHLLFAFERFFANGTLVTFGAIVLDSMQLQHVIVAEIPETYIAVVRFFTSMGARVNFQLFGARESFTATFDRTFVGFLTSMRSHVDHQLAGLDKCFAAH